MQISFVGMLGGPAGGKARGERHSMTVAEARPYLEEAEAERQFPAELLSKEAVSLCSGICQLRTQVKMHVIFRAGDIAARSLVTNICSYDCRGGAAVPGGG
jgi:hypothetical protein